MKKKITWLIVSSLMVLSLVLASCAPKVTPTAPTTPTAPITPTAPTTPATPTTPAAPTVPAAPAAEVPHYGGVLNISARSDPPVGWNTGSWLGRFPQEHQSIQFDTLMYPNPLYGPWGKGELSGLYSYIPEQHQLMGGIAESLEIDIAKERLLFKIRKGIHWQDKTVFGLRPTPMDGKELTPADVVFSYRVVWGHKRSSYPVSYPFIHDSRSLDGVKASIYLDPADSTGRTVVFEASSGHLKDLYDRVVAYTPVWWGEPYGPLDNAIGEEGYGDWRGAVGTGPLVLVDAVMGSSYTYKRNPSYWMKDPRYPENQLPYFDELRESVIPDISTQQAALRTGKIDILTNVVIDDAKSLLKTNPELKNVLVQQNGTALHMRQDKAPFDDVRVRQAMMMAINHQEIVDAFYQGYATRGWYPAMPVPEWAPYGIPLAEMPQDVQMLWEYHPDKAKQLLTEAGYPSGFTTSVIVDSSDERNVDLLSLVAAYWAKVGVKLVIDLKDNAVYVNMARTFSYKDGYFGSVAMNAVLPKFNDIRVGGPQNYAIVNQPWVEEFWPKVSTVAFDYAEKTRLVREMSPRLARFVPEIFVPAVKAFDLWEPWVGGFHGGTSWMYNAQLGGTVKLTTWIDHDLKQKMKGKR